MARDAIQEVQLLEGRARAREHADRVAACVRGLGQELGRALERVRPTRVGPLAVSLHARPEQAVLGIERVAAETVAVGDPALVYFFVVARDDAPQFPAQHVPEEIAARAVVSADERLRDHLPGPRAETVRLVVERADRAEIDDVARELVVDALLDVRADLHLVAAARRAELLDAGDLRAEAHAARALDAARHIGRDERPETLRLHET